MSVVVLRRITFCFICEMNGKFCRGPRLGDVPSRDFLCLIFASPHVVPASPDTKSAEKKKTSKRAFVRAFDMNLSTRLQADGGESMAKWKFLLSANNFGFNPSSFRRRVL